MKVDHDINRDEIVGSYMIDEFSQKSERVVKNIKNYDLTFFEDGEMNFKNLPACLFNFESCYLDTIKRVSGTGYWNTDYKPGNYTAELNVSYHFTSGLNELDNFGTTYEIYKKNGKCIIVIHLGDPDECRIVRFVHI